MRCCLWKSHTVPTSSMGQRLLLLPSTTLGILNSLPWPGALKLCFCRIQLKPVWVISQADLGSQCLILFMLSLYQLIVSSVHCILILMCCTCAFRIDHELSRKKAKTNTKHNTNYLHTSKFWKS